MSFISIMDVFNLSWTPHKDCKYFHIVSFKAVYGHHRQINLVFLDKKRKKRCQTNFIHQRQIGQTILMH